jgi:hypothetical protein
MLVKYTPEDKPNEAREWEFDPTKVRASRGEMIERRWGGGRYADWVREIQAGGVGARRVLLWHLMNLEHAQLKLEDVPDFAFGEVELDYSVSDLQKLRREVDESAMDDTAKADMLRRLDLEIATKLSKDPEDVTPADLGKELHSESAASDS